MKLIGLAGWSGAGKTTLLVRLLPVLIARGLRVSTLKHAHHSFEIDQPGKDSYAHRQAGAHEVLVASAQRFALIHEYRGEAEGSLSALLAKLSPVDLVIIEGFKRENHPKIEIYRPSLGKMPLFLEDQQIRALVTDERQAACNLPQFGFDELEAIADSTLKFAVPAEGLSELPIF